MRAVRLSGASASKGSVVENIRDLHAGKANDALKKFEKTIHNFPQLLTLLHRSSSFTLDESLNE
jgi:hypothetical protein